MSGQTVTGMFLHDDHLVMTFTVCELERKIQHAIFRTVKPGKAVKHLFRLGPCSMAKCECHNQRLHAMVVGIQIEIDVVGRVIKPHRAYMKTS